MKRMSGRWGGMSESRMAKAFYNMKQRCENTKHISFHNYGARGIKVHWNTFTEFLDDMGDSYREGYSIDRINVYGDYCKENCRWVPRLRQHYNRSNSRSISFRGKTQTLTEWSDELNTSLTALYNRLKKMPIETAFTTPTGNKNYNAKEARLRGVETKRKKQKEARKLKSKIKNLSTL